VKFRQNVENKILKGNILQQYSFLWKEKCPSKFQKKFEIFSLHLGSHFSLVAVFIQICFYYLDKFLKHVTI